MSTKTEWYTTTLATLECGVCAIPFAMPSNLHTAVVDSGRGFWCPNGHSISYHTSNADKLREEKARLEQRLASEQENVRAARADAEVERRSAAAYKGHITRLKNRVGKGKCPACSTEFPNIAEHMAHEHPGYGED